MVKTAEAMTVWLGGRFDEICIAPNLDDVPAFANERAALWARVSEASFLSDDEKRAMLGIAS